MAGSLALFGTTSSSNTTHTSIPPTITLSESLCLQLKPPTLLHADIDTFSQALSFVEEKLMNIPPPPPPPPPPSMWLRLAARITGIVAYVCTVFVVVIVSLVIHAYLHEHSQHPNEGLMHMPTIHLSSLHDFELLAAPMKEPSRSVALVELSAVVYVYVSISHCRFLPY